MSVYLIDETTVSWVLETTVARSTVQVSPTLSLCLSFARQGPSERDYPDAPVPCLVRRVRLPPLCRVWHPVSACLPVLFPDTTVVRHETRDYLLVTIGRFHLSPVGRLFYFSVVSCRPEPLGLRCPCSPTHDDRQPVVDPLIGPGPSRRDCEGWSTVPVGVGVHSWCLGYRLLQSDTLHPDPDETCRIILSTQDKPPQNQYGYRPVPTGTP